MSSSGFSGNGRPQYGVAPKPRHTGAGTDPVRRGGGVKSDMAVKSAVRVFEILELFGEARRPLRLTEIIKRFNYPASSASGLLKTMTSHGYLNYDAATHTYFPTARLSQMVSWIPSMEYEQGAVMQAMHNLHGRTQEWTVLCAISDIFVEFVEVLRSSHPIQLWSPPGTKHALVKVGVGWLFLNQMSDGKDPAQSAQIASLHRQTVARGLLSKNELSLKALHARLRDVGGKDHIFTTADTYAPHRPPGHLGGSMVSMLLPRPSSHRPLALAVGGPADRIAENLEFIVAEMRKAIKAVELASHRIFQTA